MPARPFTPDVHLGLPRVSDLHLSPDGRWLAFVVARRSVEGTKYVSDVCRVEVTPSGAVQGAIERLTVGETNDHSPRFLNDGSLLFLSARGDNDPLAKIDDAEEPTTQIVRLPPRGEPRPFTRRTLAIDALETGGLAVVFGSFVYPGARSDVENKKRDKERKESGVTALEFDAIPIRFWDRFHGPRHRHLFVADAHDPESARDLTPDARLDHDEQSFDVSRDGRAIVASVATQIDDHRTVENIVLFDAQSGEARALTEGRDSYTSPRFSPDGSRVVAVFHEHVEGKTGRTMLVLIDVSTRVRKVVTEALDLWPGAPIFSADGARLFFTADQRGDVPIFALDLPSCTVRRLTAEGSYSDLQPSPDGRTLYALRSTWDRPPEVVSLDVAPNTTSHAAASKPRPLTRTGDEKLEGIELGPVETLETEVSSGRVVQSFLVHPPRSVVERGARAPLLLWVHGGPIGAWGNHWHWRWNPHLFAARGFRVLLVNPRISTGYGQTFLDEGFGRWGAEPFTDLMAAVDHASARPDIDEGRLALMGGSFGGYMVNWIIGQTSRFRCAVTHASLWNLPAFHGTTDCGPEWEREFGNPYRDPEAYERWSPHRFVAKIRTPTMIVHGERDYRVPVSEAYMLFTALQRLGVPSKLLYYPDENHWILKPPNSAAWHASIFAWLERWLA
jgi:dipeptidyl aminopeptidase/acylaminoacyl peptidase